MHVASDEEGMRRALEIARPFAGHVEPNPLVGAVVVAADGEIVGEGAHRQFGGPHAEVFALAQAGARARGGTLFVTLEPCAHTGKTPPCAPLVRDSGVRRVVVGLGDPFPEVAGRGLTLLRDAGIDVTVGLLEDEARELNAPFLMLTTRGRPFVHAKWAMTLDGKIATRTGESQWISGEASRQQVHVLRGRMDAVCVGARTARLDDPRLTARPAGPRVATRVVVDRSLTLSVSSQLVRMARDVPVLVFCGPKPEASRRRALEAAGVEVCPLPLVDLRGDEAGSPTGLDLRAMLSECGRRRWTNLFVEGGGTLLGHLFDARLIDAAHVFIAPQLFGGTLAPSPLAGNGILAVADAPRLKHVTRQNLGDDVYVYGTIE